MLIVTVQRSISSRAPESKVFVFGLPLMRTNFMQMATTSASFVGIFCYHLYVVKYEPVDGLCLGADKWRRIDRCDQLRRDGDAEILQIGILQLGRKAGYYYN